MLIAHFDGTDAHHDRATALLLGAADEPLAASPLTLAEVLVGPARAGELDLATTALGRLEVSTVDLDSGAPARLALLRAETALKLPDCWVLLATGTSGAEMATFDDRLAAAARKRGLRVRDG